MKTSKKDSTLTIKANTNEFDEREHKKKLRQTNETNKQLAYFSLVQKRKSYIFHSTVPNYIELLEVRLHVEFFFYRYGNGSIFINKSN